jgi:hypothetical protein
MERMYERMVISWVDLAVLGIEYTADGCKLRFR